MPSLVSLFTQVTTAASLVGLPLSWDCVCVDEGCVSMYFEHSNFLHPFNQSDLPPEYLASSRLWRYSYLYCEVGTERKCPESVSYIHNPSLSQPSTLDSDLVIKHYIIITSSTSE